MRIAQETLKALLPESATVEGIFAELDDEKRTSVANALAAAVRVAVEARICTSKPLAVVLVNMAGTILGADGDLTPWK